MRKRILFIFLLCASLFIVGEISVRIHGRITKGIPFTRSAREFYDKEFGWKGKMIFGDIASEKYKIFFVGDSFTEGCGVDEEYMYYNVVGRNLGAEIFVYGGPGYGTLQEYMVLDRYIDEIRPDLIVLQVCSNDFINNLWELEKASFYNNDLMVRPYLVDGKIEYLFPKPLGRLRAALSSYSRLFYLLGYWSDVFSAYLYTKGFIRSVEGDIVEKGIAFEGFRKAAAVTDTLIRKIKQRVKDVPIIAFSVNDGRCYFAQFQSVFRDNDIEFIEDVPHGILDKMCEGVQVTLDNDTHWNEAGHRVCGEILSEKISRLMENERF